MPSVLDHAADIAWVEYRQTPAFADAVTTAEVKNPEQALKDAFYMGWEVARLVIAALPERPPL